MRKRLRLLVVGIALVLLGGWLTVWLTVPKHRINHETISLIKKGMTKQEVETVLGARPGDYGPQPTEVLYLSGLLLPGPEWKGDEAAVKICFDDNGKVTYVMRGIVIRTEVSLLDSLRRWLGL